MFEFKNSNEKHFGKIKIAFIASGRSPFIRPYLEYFQKQGHDVSLFSIDSYDADKNYGYTTFDISCGADARKKITKWRYIFSAFKLRRLLKDIKPDILHGHYATSAGIICLLSGFRPFIISARGSDLINSMKSAFWRTALRVIFAKSSLVHTVSSQLKEYAMALNVPENKTLMLTQGVNTDKFQYNEPKSKLDNPVKLLCTRRLDPVCSPEVIVEACRLLDLKGIDFRLLFAGYGSEKENLQLLVEKYSLTKKITFLGGYSNDNLPVILSENDIYVSASKWDGTSVSLLEAMASGVFPVVSDIESNKAWINDGKTGLMFDFTDAESLADTIIRAIKDDNIRISAVQANRKTILEKADRSKNMSILEREYYRILQVQNKT